MSLSRFQNFLFKVIAIATCVGGAVAIVDCSSFAKQLIKEPKVELARVGLKDVGLNGATILIGVQVENPNPFDLKIDALKYDLELGGKLLSSGEIPNALKVSGRSTEIVDISVPVKFQDLFSSVMDFLQKSSTTYHVKGEARSGLLKVPFDKTGEVKLK